jgi:hypothetical protein
MPARVNRSTARFVICWDTKRHPEHEILSIQPLHRGLPHLGDRDELHVS